MSLLLLFRPRGAEVEPPDPPPVVTVGGGVPRGAHRIPRVAARIAGRLYVGEYAEMARLIASMAEQDAAQAAADSPAPVAHTTKEAKRVARKAAAKFSALMQITDVVIPGVDIHIDPAPIAQRDLRAEYLRAYATALIREQEAAQIQAQAVMERALAEAARMEAEREADDLDAINRALELI